MDSMTVNEYDVRRAREALVMSALDAKRPTAWTQYGWPGEVSFEQLFTAYMRTGAGHGAVHHLLDRCWNKPPRIKQPEADKETPWEKKAAKALRAVKAWHKLRDFDRRNLVGRFSGLIYRVADNLTLDKPMGRGKLVELIPVYEGQLRVRWDSDKNSPNYGRPLMWQYLPRNLHTTDTQAKPEDWADVHPSRVQILAEGSAGGNFFDGVPLLLPVFNELVNLEKVSGGAAESFLKNSARTLTVNFAPDAAPQVLTQNPDGSTSTKTVREVVEDQTRALNKNQDAAMVTQGATVTTLQTSISDPTGTWTVCANAFAAGVRIPFTLLFGQQTGRLASDEDKAADAARCASRQEIELTPMVEEFIKRLQALGVIEEGEFEVEWPPVDSPGEMDRAKLLESYTQSMERAFRAGLTEPLFDGNELRGVVEYEQRGDDGMPTEGDSDADMLDPSDDAALQALNSLQPTPEQRSMFEFLVKYRKKWEAWRGR